MPILFVSPIGQQAIATICISVKVVATAAAASTLHTIDFIMAMRVTADYYYFRALINYHTQPAAMDETKFVNVWPTEFWETHDSIISSDLYSALRHSTSVRTQQCRRWRTSLELCKQWISNWAEDEDSTRGGVGKPENYEYSLNNPRKSRILSTSSTTTPPRHPCTSRCLLSSCTHCSVILFCRGGGEEGGSSSRNNDNDNGKGNQDVRSA